MENRPHDSARTNLGELRLHLDERPSADAREDCAYCGTAFDADEVSVMTLHGVTLILARCGMCGGVHRYVNTKTFFSETNGIRQHAAGCPGSTRDLAEYHATEDNTPWGFPCCRFCTVPDPLTHMVGFIGAILQKSRHESAQITELQLSNTDYVSNVRSLRQRIDRALNVVTHQRYAQRMAETVSTTMRIHADMHVDGQTFTALTPLVQHVFLAGVAHVCGLLKEEK